MNEKKGPDNLRVTGLFSYPVKGCRAIAHLHADLATSGLKHDREWMVVDARQTPATFLSQRECTIMATLAVTVAAGGGLIFTDCVGETLNVPAPASGALLPVRVWNHETVALDAGNAASTWLSAKLGMAIGALRLVRFSPQMRRDCSAQYSGDSSAHTFFADGFPLLVTSDASMANLNARMGRIEKNAMPMNRFRPNIVVEGLPAWDEDHVDTLGIGEVKIKLVKPCVRCQVTTTDQASGVRLSDEPLNTLAKFRNNPDFGGVTFGWNAVVIKPGRVSLSDPVVAEYRF